MDMIALLPMKGHSDRVPKKNIRPLGDKPLFHHIADSLFKSNLFTSLCINTDNEEIADLAIKRYPKDWLRIHERPATLCGDAVPTNEIIAHDLDILGPEHFYLQTHSTNPFLTVDTIVTAHRHFIETLGHLHDSTFSISRHQARFFDADYRPINHNPTELIRTQDLSPVYEENSCIYFFTYESFKKTRSRIGLKPGHFIVNAGSIEFLDIDTEEQWALAEAVVKCGFRVR